MNLKRIEKRLSRWLQAKRYDYTPDPYPIEEIRTAVIFIPRLIGDGMATFPVFRALQKKQVRHIIVVASEQNAMLFQPLADADEITLFVTPNLRERQLPSIRRVARAINHEFGRVDLCVDASLKDSQPSAQFVHTLRARNNLQMSGSHLRCYAPVCQPASQYYLADNPVPECWALLMKDAGIADVPGRFELPVPETVQEDVRAWLRSFEEKQQDGRENLSYIVINLDGSTASKQFSVEKGKLIVEVLWHIYQLPMVIICSPAGEEKAAALAAQYQHVTLPKLPRTLHHSAALVEHAALVFSPDTAIVHIASAHNIPVIGVYRHYNGHWVPLSEHSTMIVIEGAVEGMSKEQLEEAVQRITRL